MMIKSLLFACMLFVALLLFALPALPHVHGQGQLLIVQQGQQWQFEIILPATDLLGFEHIPENDKQKRQLADTAAKVESLQKVFSLPQTCKLTSTTHSLETLLQTSLNDNTEHANKHKHSHKHANSHEHKHDKHHQSANTHTDINLTYLVHCQEKLTSLELTLFTWATSLQTVKAQWITDHQQGAIDLTPNNKVLKF